MPIYCCPLSVGLKVKLEGYRRGGRRSRARIYLELGNSIGKVGGVASTTSFVQYSSRTRLNGKGRCMGKTQLTQYQLESELESPRVPFFLQYYFFLIEFYTRPGQASRMHTIPRAR